MPRPRNVLIPSIMLAINSGYRRVYVAGADHSWLKTLSVDDENRVVSIQPHFYKEKESEEERIRVDYMKVKLANIEVIEKLQLLYNRARQNVITNELIDIIGGANAIGGNK